MQGKTNRMAALDGLRGLSAIAVVLLHIGFVFTPVRGYLAVDIFFIMSGFVLAQAYEAKLAAGVGPGWFFGIRMARIYPLYLFGLAAALIQAMVWRTAPAGELAQSFVATALFLPHHVPGSNGPFFLDGVLWSLAAEIVVNMLYAAGGWRLSTKGLAIYVAAAGAVLLGLIIATGTANLGWTMDPLNIAGGWARVFFSFPLGVLLFRLHRAGKLPRIQLGAPLLLGAVAAVYFIRAPGVVPDIAAVFAIFPVLVVALVSARVGPVAQPVCEWLGRLSYPLYVIHAPILLWVQAEVLSRSLPSQGTIILTLALTLPPLAALALHLTIEAWGRRLVERIARSMSGAQPAAVQPV